MFVKIAMRDLYTCSTADNITQDPDHDAIKTVKMSIICKAIRHDSLQGTNIIRM